MENLEELLRWPVKYWCACQGQKDWVPEHPELVHCDGSDPRTGLNSPKLPHGPKDRQVSRYVVSVDEKPLGRPLREGTVLHLMSSNTVLEVSLAVHLNAFSCMPTANADSGADEDHPETVLSRAFSPFSSVDRSVMAGLAAGSAPACSAFKLTVVRAEGDRHYHFATTGANAEAEREQWLEAFKEGIREVTCSLFPHYGMDVRPLPGVPATFSRILAGYLLRCESGDSLSLLYSELHCYSGGEAQLVLYKDDWCDQKVFTVRLTGEMDLHSCTGVDCSMFALDGHLFAARTQDERQLWLRAAGNIKVKLMFNAPNPTHQELTAFRSAVLERILKMRAKDCKSVEAKAPVPALLPIKPRLPVKSPNGDQPADLMDDASESASRSASRMHDPMMPRASSRATGQDNAGPIEEGEEFRERVAQVLELMDPNEFRHLLAPFDESILEEGDIERAPCPGNKDASDKADAYIYDTRIRACLFK